MKMDCDSIIEIDEDGQTVDELMNGHVGLTYKYCCFFSLFYFLMLLEFFVLTKSW